MKLKQIYMLKTVIHKSNAKAVKQNFVYLTAMVQICF